MIQPKPVDLLKERLFEYEKALYKASEALKKKQITEAEYNQHKSNMEPLIWDYKQAIVCLETWMD